MKRAIDGIYLKKGYYFDPVLADAYEKPIRKSLSSKLKVTVFLGGGAGLRGMACCWCQVLPDCMVSV